MGKIFSSWNFEPWCFCITGVLMVIVVMCAGVKQQKEINKFIPNDIHSNRK